MTFKKPKSWRGEYEGDLHGPRGTWPIEPPESGSRQAGLVLVLVVSDICAR